jgi:hypothetical protein
MSDKQQLIATADEYGEIFDDHRVGKKILEDLVARFTHQRKGTGIDRLINMSEDRGRREVLDFILLRINQSNGVKNYETQD